MQVGNRGEIKMKKLCYLLVVLHLIALCGCGYSKRVAFGTTSSIGLDVDTQPNPTLSVGDDREELIVGPRYKNGAIPPVVAHIDADGGLFNASVSQIYATGNAARIVSNGSAIGGARPLKGDREVMFFGTNTNLGIKASFVGEIPKSFNFGYKRQELSVIPVGIGGGPGGTDTYGSVLAKIGINSQVENIANKNFNYESFFATGDAAENLANNPIIKTSFTSLAKNSYSAYGAGAATQKLRNFWKPNGRDINTQNESQLKTWMRNHGLTTGAGDITMFLNNQMFTEARAQAVKDLNIK